jgi:hypothetical protein
MKSVKQHWDRSLLWWVTARLCACIGPIWNILQIRPCHIDDADPPRRLHRSYSPWRLQILHVNTDKVFLGSEADADRLAMPQRDAAWNNYAKLIIKNNGQTIRPFPWWSWWAINCWGGGKSSVCPCQPGSMSFIKRPLFQPTWAERAWVGCDETVSRRSVSLLNFDIVSK